MAEHETLYQEPAVRETPDLDPELDTDPGTLRRAERGGTEEQGKVFNKYIFVIFCLSFGTAYFSSDFTP